MASLVAGVTKTALIPDPIMVREALCGTSDRGPTNITVFWPLKFLKGQFSRELCEKAIESLQELHPNLKTSFQVQGAAVRWLTLEPARVPITAYVENGRPDFWKLMVKSELRKPFNDPDLPAWRVAYAPCGDNVTLIAMTAFHALGDGVCLGNLAVQFNEVMASLLVGRKHALRAPSDVSLAMLYQKVIRESTVVLPPVKPLPFYPSQTGFAKHAFSKSP